MKNLIGTECDICSITGTEEIIMKFKLDDNIINLCSKCRMKLKNILIEFDEGIKIYKIEGIWSGYNNTFDKIVYREYTSNSDFMNEILELKEIIFEDNTKMVFDITNIDSKDIKDESINCYDDLISKCIRQGTNRVSEIID